jgi:Fis family transcriptional regulator
MSSKDSLRDTVKASIRRYLEDMDTTEPDSLHRRLLEQVEPPLIEETLSYTSGNQTRAARILGMTRNTLRSKMRAYGITPR